MKTKKVLKTDGTIVEVVDTYELKDGEEEVTPEEPEEEPEEKPEENPEEKPKEGDDEDIDEAVEKISSKIISKLGFDELQDKVETLSKDFTKKNSKLDKIFEGQTNKADYEGMTVNEKVVAFYQAAIQSNRSVLKALSEGTSADGGYLFPDEFRSEVLRTIEDKGHMRSEVRTVTMKRDVMKIPTLESGPQITWTEENEEKSTTTAHFGQATLTAYKMAAILYASDELIEDSKEIDVVKLIVELFAETIGREEDAVIAQGNGTTRPRGLITARSAGDISSTSCSGDLGFDDIIELEYSLPKEHHTNAKFYVNRVNIKELRKLKDGDNRYLWADPVQAGYPATIHGYPVVEWNNLPESEIYFGDLKKAYWLGDRKRMTVKVSQDTETAFKKDQTAIRVVERISGNVVLGADVRALISIP